MLWGKLPITIDFGDGTSDLIQNDILHTYEKHGVYEVKLNGCNPDIDLLCDRIILDSLTLNIVNTETSVIENKHRNSN